MICCVVGGIYIGDVIVDDTIIAKLNTKHQVTRAELRQALMWPARVDVAPDYDPDNGGWRWVAVATTAEGRLVICWLLPAPEWEGEDAQTWVVKTARWV